MKLTDSSWMVKRRRSTEHTKRTKSTWAYNNKADAIQKKTDKFFKNDKGFHREQSRYLIFILDMFWFCLNVVKSYSFCSKRAKLFFFCVCFKSLKSFWWFAHHLQMKAFKYNWNFPYYISRETPKVNTSSKRDDKHIYILDLKHNVLEINLFKMFLILLQKKTHRFVYTFSGMVFREKKMVLSN